MDKLSLGVLTCCQSRNSLRGAPYNSAPLTATAAAMALPVVMLSLARSLATLPAPAPQGSLPHAPQLLARDFDHKTAKPLSGAF